MSWKPFRPGSARTSFTVENTGHASLVIGGTAGVAPHSVDTPPWEIPVLQLLVLLGLVLHGRPLLEAPPVHSRTQPCTRGRATRGTPAADASSSPVQLAWVESRTTSCGVNTVCFVGASRISASSNSILIAVCPKSSPGCRIDVTGTAAAAAKGMSSKPTRAMSRGTATRPSLVKLCNSPSASKSLAAKIPSGRSLARRPIILRPALAPSATVRDRVGITSRVACVPLLSTALRAPARRSLTCRMSNPPPTNASRLRPTVSRWSMASLPPATPSTETDENSASPEYRSTSTLGMPRFRSFCKRAVTSLNGAIRSPRTSC